MRRAAKKAASIFLRRSRLPVANGIDTDTIVMGKVDVKFVRAGKLTSCNIRICHLSQDESDFPTATVSEMERLSGSRTPETESDVSEMESGTPEESDGNGDGATVSEMESGTPEEMESGTPEPDTAESEMQTAAESDASRPVLTQTATTHPTSDSSSD